jgi:long-chain acyl-CoA synthetase
LFSAIPISVYLHTFTHDHSFLPTAVVMPQDLKKFAPQAQATRRGPYTTEAAGAQPVDGETLPRRNLVAKDELKLHPSPEVKTMYDVLRYASNKFGNAKAVGSRRIVNKVTETKKIKKMIDGKEQEVDKNWEYFELSSYTYKSFVEFEKMALAAGSAIQKLGFKPKDRLHLFAATSMQWLASAHGKHPKEHGTSITDFSRRPFTVSGYCHSI